MNSNFKDLLSVIEAMIKDNIPNITYSGVVTGVISGNKRAKVKLIGGETEFELLNKTAETLSVGDSVYVTSSNKDSLTGGYIVQRFGEAIWAGGGGGGTSDYSALSNKPQINSISLVGNKTSYELSLATSSQGIKADSAIQGGFIGSTEITKTLNNLMLPSYPTTLPASDVYSWAKQPTKPTYTAGEVGALPDDTILFSGNYNDLTNKPTIPTRTSQLTNNSGFITSSALNPYALKTELPINSDFDIGGLGDVSVTSLEDNQILQYNNISGKWENKNPAYFSQLQSDWNQSNSSSVDYIKNKPIILEKYTSTIGNGVSSVFTIAHNLGTEDICVNIYKGSIPNKENIWYEIKIINSNSIRIDFGTNIPTSNSIRVVIIG